MAGREDGRHEAVIKIACDHRGDGAFDRSWLCGAMADQREQGEGLGREAPQLRWILIAW